MIRAPYLVVPAGGSPAGGQGPAPGVYDGLVEHVDLVPTILDYAGLGAAPELPGQSLRPILEGRPEAFRPRAHVICEHGVPAPAGAIGASSACARSATSTSSPLPAGPGGRPLWSCTTCRGPPGTGERRRRPGLPG